MQKNRSALRAGGLLVSITLACLFQVLMAHAQQTALDLDGRPVNPFTIAAGKVVVLVFLRQDCPVSSRYAPVIRRISAQYSREASFWLVYPDRSETPQSIRKYLGDYGYRLPALRDPERALVQQARAEITPEAAVFDRNRQLVYHGRIDNWYLEFGRARPAPTTHELNNAIQAALTGKPLPQSSVKGVGCYISDLQ
jgi:thiol-disulfide isomerase/thioredoxin